eukprot:589282-Prymnesium_polylepis.1
MHFGNLSPETRSLSLTTPPCVARKVGQGRSWGDGQWYSSCRALYSTSTGRQALKGRERSAAIGTWARTPLSCPP